MPIKIPRPNKYADLTNEIDADDLLEGLLGYGLFADKIPDFLTSKPFFDWYITNNKPKIENKGKDYIRYESMRHINVPRLLAIPNPFAYANLSNSLVIYWKEIKEKLIENVKDQNFKVSRIHIRKLKDKIGNELFTFIETITKNDWVSIKDIYDKFMLSYPELKKFGYTQNKLTINLKAYWKFYNIPFEERTSSGVLKFFITEKTKKVEIWDELNKKAGL